MLKLLALDDRYRNLRGPDQAKHDREEARTHSADTIAVVSGQADLGKFKEDFEKCGFDPLQELRCTACSRWR